MKLSHRHRCSLNISPMCTRSPGKPKRQTCAYCGGKFVIEAGLWGVFLWRGDNDYREGEAKSLHGTEKFALKVAHLLGPEYVVRWICRELVTASKQ